jgi:hypothetical protein
MQNTFVWFKSFFVVLEWWGRKIDLPKIANSYCPFNLTNLLDLLVNQEIFGKSNIWVKQVFLVVKIIFLV